MSNVLTFKAPLRANRETRLARMIATFAQDRRLMDDVFWLKENAEFLGILSVTGARLEAGALSPFDMFYAQMEERLQFFPQYYRFLLSICLDLEDLGMTGTKGEALCRWVAQQGLAEAELSDLQRAEAGRLLARRGAAAPDADLAARLHGFINRSATFAMPNKKAAYELTHIVFYLSEYGRQDPGLSAQAIESLTYAGLLAYLDQNMDLLAEVCTALRFAGQTPSPIWEQAVIRSHEGIAIVPAGGDDLGDAYHEYLVTGWMMEVSGQQGFGAQVPEGPVRFAPAHAGSQGALRVLSECMFDMGRARSGNWNRMRGHVLPYLGQEGQEVLAAAERSSDQFEAFFAGFARASATAAL